MSECHARSKHRVKNVLLPCRPVPGGQKWKAARVHLLFVTQCNWKETLTSAFGRFDTYTALLKREQVENDVRRRILQSIPDGAAYYGWCGIASKTIDFLLQFILQQPLLSQLTITVRGHWSWWSHLFVGNILHCCVRAGAAQYGDWKLMAALFTGC